MDFENMGNTFSFDKEFHDIVSENINFSQTVERFLNNLIDDITLGIIFDIHRKFKTNGFSLDVDDFSTSEINTQNMDTFGHRNKKKTQELCNCPHCDKVMAASKVAGHLAHCMGIRKGRGNSSRRTRVTNKESENPQPVNINSSDDDDDDADWSPGKKKDRKKKKGGKIKKKKGLANYC